MQSRIMNVRSLIAALGLAIAMLGLSCATSFALAGDLRYGLIESMGYPFNVTERNGVVSGGLLFDLGDRISRELGTTLKVTPVARRRADSYLLSGDIDLLCNYSPQWSEVAPQLRWSIPNIPQIERVVTTKGQALTGDIDKDFVGKRVSTQLGFQYPSIQRLFESGQAKRIDESRVPLMFKSLELKISDMLISSEGEIRAYYFEHPGAKDMFEISRTSFSVTPTQCALSPHSSFSKSQVDQVIGHLLKSGEIAAMVKRYGMSMN